MTGNDRSDFTRGCIPLSLLYSRPCSEPALPSVGLDAAALSSELGTYETVKARCRVNSAHIRQSRPDPGLVLSHCSGESHRIHLGGDRVTSCAHSSTVVWLYSYLRRVSSPVFRGGFAFKAYRRVSLNSNKEKKSLTTLSPPRSGAGGSDELYV